MEQTEASAPDDQVPEDDDHWKTDRLLARCRELQDKARELREEGRGPWMGETPQPTTRTLPDIPEERRWWNKD